MFHPFKKQVFYCNSPAFGKINCSNIEMLTTKIHPNKLSHKNGIQSNHQPITTIICVIIAATNTALDFTNRIKKANKKIPKMLP